jgi:gliding motility-associated-like protein
VGGGVTYEWVPPVNLTNPNIPNPVFIGDTTTGYIIVTTDTNNCRGRGFLTVYVLDPPVPIYDTVYNICAGDSVQLVVSGGANYNWSPSTGLSNASIANPLAFPIVTTNYSVTVAVGNCEEIIQVTVNVSDLSNVSAGNDTTVCRGTAVTLNASGGNTYSWSPANTLSNPNIANPTATITATTTYIVNISVGIGCSGIDSVTITATDPIPISASADVLKCAEDTVTLTVTGASNYTWQPNTNISDNTIDNPQVFPTTNTIYAVSAIDINGCPTADSVLVSIVIIQPVDAGLDQSICIDESAIIGGNPTADNSAIVFWTGISGDISNLNSTTIQNPLFNAEGLAAGTYTYQVSATQQGCDAGNDEVTIIVNPNPEANIVGLNSLYCLEGAGSTLTGIPPGGTFSGLGINGNNFNPQQAGLNNFIEITYTVTDANGCFDDTIQNTQVVNYTVDAGEDQTITIYDSIQLSPSTNAVFYQWSPEESLSCANCINPFASPTVTTTYNLIATDENGCAAQDNVTIEVFVDTLLWIPNAFSPNGDGENDVFRIFGKSIKTIEFKIFNRWGELMFYTTDPNQGWDGTYKGKPMVPGVYVYMVEATYINDFKSKTEKGSFVLVR